LFTVLFNPFLTIENIENSFTTFPNTKRQEYKNKNCHQHTLQAIWVSGII